MIKAMLGAAALAVFCAGCGSSDDGNEQTAANDTLAFTTGAYEIPPGDSFECFFTDTFTETDVSVRSASGVQMEGGHHITVYWAETERAPTHYPCIDAEMASLHQIAAAGGASDEDVLNLPEGFALHVPAGKQLVVQSHYINLSNEARTVDDRITLYLEKPDKVEDYVNYLVTLDDAFEVPAHTSGKSTSVCTLERDFDMILSLPHMHEWGSAFTLDEIDENGNVVQNLMKHDQWQELFVSHPPINRYDASNPLHLPAGTRLRQTCEWDNNTVDPLIFPREMCLAFFYYFPDDGEIVCDTVPE